MTTHSTRSWFPFHFQFVEVVLFVIYILASIAQNVTLWFIKQGLSWMRGKFTNLSSNFLVLFYDCRLESRLHICSCYWSQCVWQLKRASRRIIYMYMPDKRIHLDNIWWDQGVVLIHIKGEVVGQAVLYKSGISANIACYMDLNSWSNFLTAFHVLFSVDGH